MTSAAASSDLGPGVGRVPAWWMELTPHYVLDLEREAADRRTAEENMGYFYDQMDRCKDGAEFLGPDGRPIIGPDGRPLRGLPSTWGGRGTSGGGQEDDVEGGGCLGRNFKVGTVSPESLALLGIPVDHPDYQTFLSGARLPPGYWDLLGALGYEGIANNLKQTSYGRYGRQADRPKFKPAWAGLSLRCTDSGARIRQGQYDDSPGKFSRRTVGPNAALAAMEARTGNGGPPLSSASLQASAENNGEYNDDDEEEEEEYYDEDMDGGAVDDTETEDYDDEDDDGGPSPAAVDPEVENLQKILAAKMAELARLQAGG